MLHALLLSVKFNQKSKYMKYLYYVCCIALFIALFKLRIEYYTFLRILIFTGAMLIIKNEIKRDVNLLGIAFIIIAILFNPFIPVYLLQKAIWIPIDVGCAFLFGIYSFRK